MYNSISFATLRLGKSSVEDIKNICSMQPGIRKDAPHINVTCTQIPDDFVQGTFVFIWLGSDNNKGMATQWKQGFKAFGRLISINRGDSYNDSSTFEIEMLLIFSDAVSRLDFLRETPEAYYWFSAMPIIGLDDHSNQTVRMIQHNIERNDIQAFLYSLSLIINSFREDFSALNKNFENLFKYTLRSPKNGEIYFSPSKKQLQVIYYGAPGTGKSHTVDGIVKEDADNYQRVTFHPDTDYSSFVGCYKPTKDPDTDKLTYAFVAQPFLKAYIEAWKRYAESLNTLEQSEAAPYYLLIEEINRGNCAQIFGDVFQLLDRDDRGFSKYWVTPDTDITNFLAVAFAEINLPDQFAKIVSGEKMRLPNNLYIYATMNTSDQSLFPIDSAFKRRWDWKYTPITDGGKGYVININGIGYDWYTFISTINKSIYGATNSEDKQMGYWFVHLPEGDTQISQETFISKVLFYLWSDIYKDFGKGGNNIFQSEDAEGKKTALPFHEFFDGDVAQKIHDFMRHNKIKPMGEIVDFGEDASDNFSEDNTSFISSVNGTEVKGLRGVVKEALRQYRSQNNISIEAICDKWNNTFTNIPMGRGDNLFLLSDSELERLAAQKATTDPKYKDRYCHMQDLHIWGGWTKDTITSFIDKVNNSDLGITIESK